MNSTLIIQICLWGMFVIGLAITILTGISPIGIMATVGMLLLAIDFPKKNKRNK